MKNQIEIASNAAAIMQPTHITARCASFFPSVKEPTLASAQLGTGHN
jgi:hypothetical protein